MPVVSSALNESLLSADDRASEFISDYIHEVSRVSDFFTGKVSAILVEMELLKHKYEGRRLR